MASEEFVLKSSEFRREREASWRALEALLQRVESAGIDSLNHEELTRLPTLYRGVVGALSVARAISLDRNLLDYLTDLSIRAHLVVYAGRRRPVDAFVHFVGTRFPRLVRGFRVAFALALASLIVGVLCGYLMTTHDPERYYSFVPSGMVGGRTPEAPTDSLRAVLYSAPKEEGQLDVFASFLFSHNASIGILCLALGFAAGIPVIFLLFTNGLTLGAMAALYASRGLGAEFWAWVLPHGVTELLAVVLCGTTGLVFGACVVLPGPRGRLETLARRGREAGLVVIGAVGLFFIAALLEGFFRQLVQAPGIRWAVALTSAAAWLLYFVEADVNDVARADRRSLREIVTPEGTALPFRVASVFDRAGAVLLDLVLIHLAVLLVFVLALLAAGLGLGLHALAPALAASFLLRNFYFAWFEIRGGGMTPGKRRMHLRVVSRDGGPLTAEAVLARNLTREFELFLPLTAMLSPGALWPDLPAGAALFGSAWLFVGALTPLFNRDRLRLGDLLGGTLVVAVPDTLLLDDPALARSRRPAATGEPRFQFTRAHLDQYGIEELQVLEDLLRRAEAPTEAPVLAAVAERIQAKIGWEPAVEPEEVGEFLQAFYRQLRARLEHKALFGDRQMRKREGKLARREPEAPRVMPAPDPPPDPAALAEPAMPPESGAPTAEPQGPGGPSQPDPGA